MKCTQCKTELSKDAKVCPQCGREVFGKPEKIFSGVLLFLIIAGVYYFFFSSEPKKEVIPEKSVVVVEQKVETQEPVSEKQEEKKPESTPAPEPEPEPMVGETAIKMVCDTMKQHTLISDIAIKVEEDKKNINIVIVANAAIKPEIAREYGEDSVRMLSSLSESKESPTKDFIGGLYNEYDLHIGIFTSGEKTIARGTKLKGLPKLTWR